MKSPGMWSLAFAGASAFWIVNLLISLTPLAADYRSSLSISYTPMLIQAALGGILIGICVSWILLRFPERIPGETPMAKSVFLSLAVLIAGTVLIEVPGKFLAAVNDPWRYLFIGAAFNTLRILALGIVIGYLSGRTRRP